MVEIAAEKGVTLTLEEVKGLLKQMDEADEFDDIELDIVALAVLAGGGRAGGDPCGTSCHEQAHEEPWEHCPVMRPMCKRVFGGSPLSV